MPKQGEKPDPDQEAGLTAAQKLAVRREVEGTLTKLAALFGVANIAVLIGAIWFMWTSVTNQTAGLAPSIKADVLADLSSSREQLNAAVNEANQLIGRLQQSQDAMENIEGEIEGLRADLAALADRETLERAADFIRAWGNAPDVDAMVQQTAGMLRMPGCKQVRIVTGQTPVGATDWKRYKETRYGAYVEVDTSSAGFTATPLYLTSLGGTGGHWFVAGPSAVYSPSADGFKVYLRWLERGYSQDLVPYAQKAKWHINWWAIGC